MRLLTIDPIIAFTLMLIFLAGVMKFNDVKLESMKRTYTLMNKKLMAHEILRTIISDEKFLDLVSELRAGNMAQANHLMDEILSGFECELLIVIQVENITYVYGNPKPFTDNSTYGFSRVHIAGLNMILECYVA